MRQIVKQEFAFNEAIKGTSLFITGGAGTGKSTLLRRYIDWCKENNKRFMVTASTGVAALNIGGVTTHRAFHIPFMPIGKKMNKALVAELVTLEVLIIDEISILRIDAFEYLAESVMSINKLKAAVGLPPLQLIFVGDFGQLPPVVTLKDAELLDVTYPHLAGVGGYYAFQSKLWWQLGLRGIQLTEVVRQSDEEFIHYLNQVRLDIDSYQAARYIQAHSSKTRFADAINIVGRNDTADRVNLEELQKLNKPIRQYTATIKGEVNKQDMCAPEELELCIGARVMSVINNSELGYFNGSLGYVTDMQEDYIEVAFDDGTKAQVDKFTWEIQKYTVSQKKGVEAEVIGTYKQFPLRLAYAITIHKSQGQTFTKANISFDCWAPGQLYVALSRVTSVEGVYAMNPISTRNIVCSSEVKKLYTYMDRIGC